MNRLPVFFLLLALAGMAGCGGGSSSSSSTTTTTVTISPATATVGTGLTQQFTGTVTNNSNTAVTWQVNGVSGGTSTVGTITTAGLYTAPTIVPTPATVTVTAVSQAVTTQSATAGVTITSTTPQTFLTITPSSATLPAGSQQTFAATVNNQPANVTWTVSCQSQAAGACGTIGSATGVYTAPLSPPPGQGVTITATTTDNSAPPASAGAIIQFSNASLKGQYAFTLAGQNAGALAITVGSVTFDGGATGPGIVSGGIQDINGDGGTATAITGGAYHVGSDGRGTMSITTASGTVNLAVAVVSHSRAYITRTDSGAAFVGSGSMDLQDSTQFNQAAIKGNYAFSLTGLKAGAASVTAGALTADGNLNITGGTLDSNSGGTLSSAVPLTASTYTAPSSPSGGRGTLSIITTSGTQTFAYYIVDAAHLKWIETDTTQTVSGDWISQPAAPSGFTKASYTGPFAFVFGNPNLQASQGQGGVFTLDGAGNVQSSLSVLDVNSAGTPLQNGAALSGTYSVATADAVTGRTTITWNAGTSTYTYVAYPALVGGKTALRFVETSTGNTGGTAFAQTGSPFTAGRLLAHYAASFTGRDLSSGEEDISGLLQPNGGAAIAGTLDINDGGAIGTGAALSNSQYQVASSGRGNPVTINAGSFSNATLTLYVVDTGDVLFLETDPDRVLTGIMQKQY